MSVRVKRGTHVLQDVRTLVRDRMDEALRDLRRLDKRYGDNGVHTARKRFKEIRALLRLLRDQLGERTYRRESRVFQRVGRPLSALRDATIILNSLDAMILRFGGSPTSAQFEPLRRRLLRRQRKARCLVRRHWLSRPILLVDASRDRAERWSRDGYAWGVITQGLVRMYVGGRMAMRTARSLRSNAELHEWRKRVTALRYALEALQCICPRRIALMARRARALSTLLGDDHDLAVLQDVARQEADRQWSSDVSGLLKVIDRRRRNLQKRAFSIGGELYVETRVQFLERLNAYWKEGRWRTFTVA